MAEPNLTNLFGNIFNDKNYSDTHFSTFFDKELELMAGSNTGGRFDAILAASSPKKLAWDTARGKESSDLVHQLTGTKGDNMAITKSLTFIRLKDSYLITKLVGKPLVYAAMMPRGMGEYTHAGKSGIKVLLERYRDMAIVHVADLDGTFITDCEDMVTTYEDANAIHKNTMSDEVISLADCAEKRTTVELQAMANLRMTADIFENDMENCIKYHPFHLLKSVPQKAHINKAGQLTVGQQSIILKGEWAANMRIRLTALTGDEVGGSISIALVELENDPMPANAKRVKNPKTRSFTAAQLQVSPKAACLILKSNNRTVNCLFKIEIYRVND